MERLRFQKTKGDVLRTIKNYKTYIIETKFIDKMPISANQYTNR